MLLNAQVRHVTHTAMFVCPVLTSALPYFKAASLMKVIAMAVHLGTVL